MQEAISFMACAELPAVIVNIMRCGPGLGGILPSQADYFQATRGGGTGTTARRCSPRRRSRRPRTWSRTPSISPTTTGRPC
jgi:hypothetical protein